MIFRFTNRHDTLTTDWANETGVAKSTDRAIGSFAPTTGDVATGRKAKQHYPTLCITQRNKHTKPLEEFQRPALLLT